MRLPSVLTVFSWWIARKLLGSLRLYIVSPMQRIPALVLSVVPQAVTLAKTPAESSKEMMCFMHKLYHRLGDHLGLAGKAAISHAFLLLHPVLLM